MARSTAFHLLRHHSAHFALVAVSLLLWSARDGVACPHPWFRRPWGLTGGMSLWILALVCLLALPRVGRAAWPRTGTWGLLLAATACIYGVAWASCDLYVLILPIFTVWLAVFHLPRPQDRLWLGLQLLLLAGFTLLLVRYYAPATLLPRAFGLAVLYVLAAVGAGLHRRESEARDILQARTQELEAVCALVGQGSMLAERNRIARELHDGLGHHLAALNVQLEAALAERGDQREARLQQGRTLAREMLREVQDTLQAVRGEAPVDLEAFLYQLLPDTESLRTRLTLKGDPALEDPGRAHVLLRCAQELVTNAVRHARATELGLEVEFLQEGVRLLVQDDGVGAPRLQEGHGLRGIRERLAAVGGRLHLFSDGPGFRAAVWIPLARVQP